MKITGILGDFDVHTFLRPGQPPRTLHPLSVAVLSQNGLLDIGAGEVVVENFIHHHGDGLVEIAAVNPFVVEGGGGGDGKIIALSPIPFCRPGSG